MLLSRAGVNWLSTERRLHPRLARTFNGTWQGAAATGQCRITDMSLGGCFVQTLAAPVVGDKTVVTVTIGSQVLSFSGEIRYVEPNIGFAVQFQKIPETEIDELARLLDALRTSD